MVSQLGGVSVGMEQALMSVTHKQACFIRQYANYSVLLYVHWTVAWKPRMMTSTGVSVNSCSVFRELRPREQKFPSMVCGVMPVAVFSQVALALVRRGIAEF